MKDRSLSHPRFPDLSPHLHHCYQFLVCSFGNIPCEKEPGHVIQCFVILHGPLTPLRIGWKSWILTNYPDQKMWHTILLGVPVSLPPSLSQIEDQPLCVTTTSDMHNIFATDTWYTCQEWLVFVKKSSRFWNEVSLRLCILGKCACECVCP